MSLEIQNIIDNGAKLTPMMEQYFEIKKKYIDHLLMFRMGDFYEVFFEDAKRASQILNIALTHRGKLGDTPIPMAGIPHHAAATYIDRFTSHGLKVAICEQIEDPKEAKGIVKRAVTQVVSPAMPYDLEKTSATENHFIACAQKVHNKYHLIAIDFTTGHFKGFELASLEALVEKIRQLNPKEFLTYIGQWDKEDDIPTLLNHLGSLVTNLSSEYFSAKFTEIYLEKIIPTFRRDQIIQENIEILNPIGALSYYICSTQSLEEFVHIQPFSIVSEIGFMKVTTPTLTGLEILPKSKESYADSLLGFMDKTKTSLGARYLKEVFSTPLVNIKAIKARQEVITYFLENEDLLLETRELLTNVRDLERIMAKVSTAKANASDLINIARSVEVFNELSLKLSLLPINNLKEVSREEALKLDELKNIINLTINDEIGASLEKGNLIKPGSNKERDKLASLSQNAANELIELESKYREQTGIQKLKIKSNNVNGYFIEVSKSHTDKMPSEFVRRQTLVNSERYTTKELDEFEKEVLLASERLQKLEREIFKSIIESIVEIRATIHTLALVLAKIDVLQSFSFVARSEDFKKPTIVEGKRKLSLKGAWHPIIKAVIKDQFVSHDLELNEQTFFGLITGPNMAGKTTVMREVAIIQHLTQIGSFVPCDECSISICDFLFSRLGASDDILKGQSTFMVEMAETAEILRHATNHSLIILDEVGRGTSTYDGLSIAWALVEHFIQKTKAFCLFATHYHELIELADSFSEAKNLTVETMNHKGNVKFLYRLIEKAASQSFGIYVAKLAGVPQDVLKRSTEILKSLEKNHHQTSDLVKGSAVTQLDIFSISNSSIEKDQHEYENEENEDIAENNFSLEDKKSNQILEEKINELDLNNLTPLQALLKLSELKELLHSKGQ